GPVPESADERRGGQPRREDANPSPEPHPAAAAVAPRADGPPDPRLPAQWPDESVCGVGDYERPRPGRVRTAAYRRRLPALHAAGRAPLPWPGVARRPRQLVYSFDARGADVAQRTSGGPVPLHAEGRVLAQHGRGVVRHPHAQVGPAWLVPHRPRSDPAYVRPTHRMA